MSQLLNRNNTEIEFTDEEANAVLKGDFSLRVIRKSSELETGKKFHIPSFVFYAIIGLIALVAIFYIMKHVKKKGMMSADANTNKKNISYSKI